MASLTSPEPIGKRIARLRSELGWTQQALAYRLAASRVAISHIEMDLTTPSERTITLLAGLFKLSPQALVEGTTYPQARAERLPGAACCFTPIEAGMALLENDLDWLERLESSPAWESLANEVRERWSRWLEAQQNCVTDEIERQQLALMRSRLKSIARRLEP